MTYCSVGYRSSAMAQRLAEGGTAEVFNLKGSIFSGRTKARPLEREGKPAARRTSGAGPQNQQRTCRKKHRAAGECNAPAEGRPQHAHDDAGEEIAGAVHRGERAESDAVVRFIHQLGAVGILDRFLHRHVDAADDEDTAEHHQPSLPARAEQDDRGAGDAERRTQQVPTVGARA